jgi:flagellar biosynthesis/type III secretory pathway protein FliH
MRRCIEEGVLADYLRERMTEVPNMILEEWDEERQAYLVELEKREIREEGREEGLEQGREEERRGLLDRAIALVREGRLDPESAALMLDPEEAGELARMVAAGE